MAYTWIDNIKELLNNTLDDKTSSSLINKYKNIFPSAYCERYPASEIANDIQYLESLSEKNTLRINFFQVDKNNVNELHLKIYQIGKTIAFSDLLPMLENIGLRVESGVPYELNFAAGSSCWICDFKVIYTGNTKFDIVMANAIFQEAMTYILSGQCENDGFNRLLLDAELSWREICIIRAYSKYLQQAKFAFSQSYIERTLSNYPDYTKNLVNLFRALYSPSIVDNKQSEILYIESKLGQILESVSNFDEDKTLRRFWQMIKATLRTNYYQSNADGSHKTYISFKLDSSAIPELPVPKPLYEIFVYSTRFEGIHLRMAKVSRGGIRWSSRHEDYRTEILGLMKAQKVKNSVIVPSGAKGGFVVKQLRANTARETAKLEIVACYKLFISGLLDLTDNIVNDKIVHPKNTICYDNEDAYLVVASDKGTSDFSDIANSISNEYQFWLGDAFASGGSTGYDHKKMGITARGAWESIKRHFREINMSLDKDEIKVVGIGDMSGDVFGNGMLYSDHINLIAAFDHRHIFLDPNPDARSSFLERQRLFNLPSSSWEDYQSNCISQGGGVFSRSVKAIAISPEVRDALAINDEVLAPDELIRAILKAPVDLLYNGGIGTYVKAESERQADVGDKANDLCRVNGADLRCKVVGEGGNLGFTQLGRVEYALKGGLINTDFIDNSAGVDCSDHEVNIKILLKKKVDSGELTIEKRNELLLTMSKEVAELVLHDNYQQALVMSFSAAHSASYNGLYLNNIKKLESAIYLDRIIEALPTNKQLFERQGVGQGLTRPELAILLAYTKIHIKTELLNSALPEERYFARMLESAFPASLVKKYRSDLINHHLSREIIATQVSNFMVNAMGITYAYRMQAETGACISDIARAYMIASTIYQSTALQKEITSLDFKISSKLQHEMLHHVRYLINLASRWFLRNDRLNGNVENIIQHYQSCIDQLADVIPHLIVGSTKGYLETLNEQFISAGLPTDISKRVALSRVMYAALNVAEIATQHGFNIIDTAKIYFEIGGKFGLVRFRDQLVNDHREGDINSMARLSLRDDLDTLQRQLTIVIMQSSRRLSEADEYIPHWMSAHQSICERWDAILDRLNTGNELEYTSFFIALRELMHLVEVCDKELQTLAEINNLCTACQSLISGVALLPEVESV